MSNKDQLDEGQKTNAKESDGEEETKEQDQQSPTNSKKKKKQVKAEKNLLDMESSSDEDILADEKNNSPNQRNRSNKDINQYNQSPSRSRSPIKRYQSQSSQSSSPTHMKSMSKSPRKGDSHLEKQGFEEHQQFPSPAGQGFHLSERQRSLVRYCRKLEELKNEQRKITSIVELSTLQRLKDLLCSKTYPSDLVAQAEVVTLLIERVPHFQMLKETEQFYKEGVLKLAGILEIEEIQQKKPIYVYNEDAEYLYLLLDGSLAEYSPKAELIIDKEIKLKYDILKVERIYQNILNGDTDVAEAYPNTRQQLKYLYEIRNRHSNQADENFLREVSNNSSRYFRFEQQLCTFKKESTILPGQFFGTLAIGKDKRRISSVFALENSTIVKIKGWQYAKIFKNEYDKREELQKALILLFPATLFLDRLNILAYQFKEKHFFQNQNIFSQGDYFSNYFYYVVSGKVEILRAQEDKTQGQHKLTMEELFRRKVGQNNQTKKNICAAVLEKGEFFGQEDLLEKRPRTFTARSAVHLTVVLQVPRNALLEVNSITFLQILKKIGRERIQRYEERLEQVVEIQNEGGNGQKSPENATVVDEKQAQQKRDGLINQITHLKVTQISKKDEGIPYVEELPQEDPSKDKNLVFGDLHNFQKLKKRMIMRMESNAIKGKLVKTYHQKGIRPDVIHDANDCNQYVNTLPSLVRIRSRPNILQKQSNQEPVIGSIILENGEGSNRNQYRNNEIEEKLNLDLEDSYNSIPSPSLIWKEGNSIEKHLAGQDASEIMYNIGTEMLGDLSPIKQHASSQEQGKDSQLQPNHQLETSNNMLLTLHPILNLSVIDAGQDIQNISSNVSPKKNHKSSLNQNNDSYNPIDQGKDLTIINSNQQNNSLINASLLTQNPAIAGNQKMETVNNNHSSRLSMAPERKRFSSLHIKNQQVQIFKKNRNPLLSPTLGRYPMEGMGNQQFEKIIPKKEVSQLLLPEINHKYTETIEQSQGKDRENEQQQQSTEKSNRKIESTEIIPAKLVQEKKAMGQDKWTDQAFPENSSSQSANRSVKNDQYQQKQESNDLEQSDNKLDQNIQQNYLITNKKGKSKSVHQQIITIDQITGNSIPLNLQPAHHLSQTKNQKSSILPLIETPQKITESNISKGTPSENINYLPVIVQSSFTQANNNNLSAKMSSKNLADPQEYLSSCRKARIKTHSSSSSNLLAVNINVTDISKRHSSIQTNYKTIETLLTPLNQIKTQSLANNNNNNNTDHTNSSSSHSLTTNPRKQQQQQQLLKQEEYFVELPAISSNSNFPLQRLPNNIYSLALQRTVQNNLQFTKKDILLSSGAMLSFTKHQSPFDDISREEKHSQGLVAPFKSSYLLEGKAQRYPKTHRSTNSLHDYQQFSNISNSPVKLQRYITEKNSSNHMRNQSQQISEDIRNTHKEIINPNSNNTRFVDQTTQNDQQTKGLLLFKEKVTKSTQQQSQEGGFSIKLQELQQSKENNDDDDNTQLNGWQSTDPSTQLFQQYLQSEKSLELVQQHLTQQFSCIHPPSIVEIKSEIQQNQTSQQYSDPNVSQQSPIKQDLSVNTAWNDILFPYSPTKSPGKYQQFKQQGIILDQPLLNKAPKVSSIASGSVTERHQQPCIPNVLFPIFAEKKKKIPMPNFPLAQFSKLVKRKEDINSTQQQQEQQQQQQPSYPIKTPPQTYPSPISLP